MYNAEQVFLLMTEIHRTTSTDSNYILDRNDAESARLTGQYEFIKSVSGLDTAVPSDIDLSKVSRILDVAAGNLVWTLDIASHPGIKERLSLTCPSPVRLYACDLSSSQFPSSSILESRCITTFEHDITTPFPSKYEEYFDLVHMSMLVAALSETGWNKALENVRKLLRKQCILFSCLTSPLHCH